MNAARLWIVWLVALALGALAAGTDLAFRHLYDGGAGRRVLLLPRESTSEEKRAELLKGLLALPEAAAARWLSPGDIAQEAAQSLERDRWPEIFPQDEAWLPWMAELTLRNPFRDPQPARDRVRALKASPEWRLAIWDERAFEHDRALLARLLALAGGGGLLLLIFGMQAIRLAPRHASPLALQLLAHLVLPAVGLAALGAIAWALGIQIDPRTIAVAGSAVLILAGLLPVVLKGPGQS